MKGEKWNNMNKIWTCMFEWLNAHPAPPPTHQVTQRITVLVPNRIKSSHTKTKVCEQELSVFAGHNFSAMIPCAQRVHVHDSKGVLSTGVGWRGRSPVSEAIVLLFNGNFQLVMVLLLVLILGHRYVGTFGAVRCILPGRRQWCRRTRLSSTHPPRPTSHTHRFKPLSSAWCLRLAWQTASSRGLVGLPCSSLWLLWLSIRLSD